MLCKDCNYWFPFTINQDVSSLHKLLEEDKDRVGEERDRLRSESCSWLVRVLNVDILVRLFVKVVDNVDHVVEDDLTNLPNELHVALVWCREDSLDVGIEETLPEVVNKDLLEWPEVLTCLQNLECVLERQDLILTLLLC